MRLASKLFSTDGPTGRHPNRCPRHASGHHIPGFAWGRPRTLGPGKPPPDPACHPRHSTRYPTGNRFPTPTPSAPRRERQMRTEVSIDLSDLAGSWPVREYQPVHPFDYACRPRLRTRLTRGRRTWPRNPWSSSGRDPHPSLATHVCILTPTRSTAGFHRRFAPCRTLSYPATMKIAAASSVVCLSPATLSARNH